MCLHTDGPIEASLCERRLVGPFVKRRLVVHAFRLFMEVVPGVMNKTSLIASECVITTSVKLLSCAMRNGLTKP